MHSQFDLSLWNRRMIAYGVERQKIFVLGFAVSQNATSHRIHLEARSSAQQVLASRHTPQPDEAAPTPGCDRRPS
ncbi:hypothetical protein BCL76_105359 [Streptomyces sp. CG 926]|uniref:hypothetical protein n=1 Tax=Streptomyces sp. CG 926 TaxID=1882405 RepID=UPI000D6DB0F5|nr:hypothetical protein [Streptomyces sp. CG 926]PWK70405.1 hypothetical protein BCL76_105359 [Streptomyces sp. CG 926]